MYHFVADHSPVPVRLSFRASVPGHVRQYLKQFQIDAIQFMHNFLAKGEFCCYNDESGLGKQASVAVLLDAACGNKKTLIVVQNDDCYVHGWEFHFSVLTKSNVMVIKEKKDSTNTAHNIYIAKWSTLRAMDDLSKLDFDFIIVDNRGQMLNNSFCLSMLLKHYERKINILISSVDITSDLKHLHNILKLGGRLDPRYTSFKTFEEKFKLPDPKELLFKKADLEEYFMKRERLVDYCKNFRLRRYYHQFEQQLPLVAADRYKINLAVWKERQSATNSEGSSVEVTSRSSRPNEAIRDTQELFEEYCKQRRQIQEREKLQQKLQQEKEQQQRREEAQREKELKRLEAQKAKETEMAIIYNVDDEVALINAEEPILEPVASRENNDEGLLMSPLLVVSDSEDLDDVPVVCNDPNDDKNIVDLSSDEENNQNEQEQLIDGENDNGGMSSSSDLLSDEEENNCNKNKTNSIITVGNSEDVEGSEYPHKERNGGVEQTVTKKVCVRRKKHITEAEKLKADVATNLKFMNEKTPKRRTRHEEHHRQRLTTRQRMDMGFKKTPCDKKTSNAPNKQRENGIKYIKKEKDITCIDLTKKKDKHLSSTESELDRSKSKGNLQREKDITKEKTGNTEKSTASSNSNLRPNNRPTVQDEIPTSDAESVAVIKIENDEHKVLPTRRSQYTKMIKIDRIKRELDIDHVTIHNRETRSMQRSTRSAPCSNKYSFTNLSLHNEKTKPKKKIHEKGKTTTTAKQGVQPNKSQSAEKKHTSYSSQAPVIAMTCSQDYDRIECAQRLSDDSQMHRKSPEVLPAPTPPASMSRNSLIPSSFASSNGLMPDSDIMFLPPPAPKSQGNRITTARQQQRNEDVIILSGSETENSLSSTSRRTRALKPRKLQKSLEETGTATKSATFSQLLAQHNKRQSTKSPDLFSNCSEINQLTLSQPPQENAAGDEPSAPFEGFKIFGSEVKQLQQHYALSKSQVSNVTVGKTAFRNRSCLDILEKMFDPSNRKAKSNNTTDGATLQRSKSSTQKARTPGPIVPNHPIEAIAEEARAQKDAKQRRSLGLPLNEDEIFEITSNGTFGSVMRLHSNGHISPVQQTQKCPKIPNKITKYFLGGQTQTINSSQEDNANNSESGTPTKKQQQQQVGSSNSTQVGNTKKSPKQKSSSTQVTKLTKWFTKNNSPSKQLGSQVAETSANAAKRTQKAEKRPLKRRRLDLTQVRDEKDCI